MFLVNAVLQSIPIITNLSPFTAIGPLIFVLLLSLIREAYEDYVHIALSKKRHKKDAEINTRPTQLLRNGVFVDAEWQDVHIGDFVKIRNGEFFPADILLLHSSEENSICYVETANLDG